MPTSDGWTLKLRAGGTHIVSWRGNPVRVRFSREGTIEELRFGSLGANDLCEFPLAEIVETLQSGPVAPFAAAAAHAQPGPRGYPQEHYREVAKVCAEAGPRGVMERLHVSRSTAYAWVARARELGFLRSGDGRFQDQTGGR